MKRTLTTLILLVMVLTSVIAFSSCNLFHKHSYTATPSSTPCTEAGTITYTCSCGDSYTEDVPAQANHDLVKHKGVAPTCFEEGYYDYEECSRCGYTTKEIAPATGHYYVIESLVYPTPTTDGERVMKCSDCGDSKTETISSATFALPTCSEIVAALLGELTAKVELDANSMMVLGEVSSNYEYCDGYKNFYAIKLGKAELSAPAGVAQGYLDIQLGYVKVDITEETDYESIEAPDFTTAIDLYIYLDGDNVSVEMVENNHKEELELDANEVLYGTLGRLTGLDLSYDDFLKASYSISQFTGIVDDLTNLVKGLANIQLPMFTPEFIADLQKVATLFGQKFVTSTTALNGSTTYELDVTALQILLDEVKGKTVSQVLDSAYGAGSAESIKSLLASLPSMKIKDIANTVIDFAEASGADVNEIYAFIDVVIYAVSDGKTSVNIREQIETNYNLLLIEAIYGVGEGQTPEEAAAEVSGRIVELVDKVYSLDVDALYRLVTYGDPDHTIDGEKVSITENLTTLISQLGEVTSVEIVVDAEGVFVSLAATVGDVTVNMELTEEGNGVNILVSLPNGASVVATVGEYGLKFSYSIDNDVLLEGGAVYSSNEGIEVYQAYFYVGEYRYLDFYQKLVNGESQNLYLEINYMDTIEHELYDEESGKYYYETEQEFKNALVLEMTAAGNTDHWTLTSSGNSFTLDVTEGEGSLSATLTVTEGNKTVAIGRLEYTESFDGELLNADLQANLTVDGIQVVYYSYEIVDNVLSSSILEVKSTSSYDEVNGEYVKVDTYVENTFVFELLNTDDQLSYTLNVYDRNDVLGYSAAVVATEVEGGVHLDFDIPTLPVGTRYVPAYGDNDYIVEDYSITSYLMLDFGVTITLK